MKTVKIYRSILLNEGEEINAENLGCSWTLCEIFAEDHAKDINGHFGKDGFVILSTEVDEDQIDWSNTLFAMEERDHEFEVVISGDIVAEVEYSTVESIGSGLKLKGNSGQNNFEDYCDNYDGEVTKDDFFELASEF